MENLDNVKYEMLSYSKYKENLDKCLKDEKLISMGIKHLSLGKTEYGYDIDCVSIGNGDKHLFVVGGTHGSEMISVDFASQFITGLKYFENFDPNEFTIFVIPTQNPEGFSVTTDVINSSMNEQEFQKNSLEYFYRYKIDNITSFFNKNFNDFIFDNNFINASDFLEKFKSFIRNDKWINVMVKDKKLMPNFDDFINSLMRLDNSVSDYSILKYSIINICNNIIDKHKNDLSSAYLIMFVDNFKKHIESHELWEYIDNTLYTRLHQEMFKNVSLDSIRDEKLRDSVKGMFSKYSHPLGSQIDYDATGVGINLNANNKINPGIEAIRNGDIIMNSGAKGNIRNYVPGPKGIPTLDVNKFEYAKENKVLYELINASYESGNYCGTFLYHGTGGMIFYKPYESLMDSTSYNSFYSYNEELAGVYNRATGYKLIEGSDKTGYGDLLRRTFPGVLLVELSRMGGNPIAPYGDKDNIYRTFNENYKALDEIMGYISKKKGKGLIL